MVTLGVQHPDTFGLDHFNGVSFPGGGEMQRSCDLIFIFVQHLSRRRLGDQPEHVIFSIEIM